ncbi:hypothetical protein GGI07_003810 [Coemansia sp. Benny D115]|nr:hypothetical protein GGI07_003810 [Coemansia sp. Benny D115]
MIVFTCTIILFMRALVSTVEAGTAYENLVVDTFNRLGAQLERVGGANDQGIDFRGFWSLPKQHPFYLIGQCKYYEHKRIGPSVIREWEGVMSRQEMDTLGVVATTGGFTRHGVNAVLSSAYPIALATIDGGSVKFEDRIQGFVWNRAAEAFIGKMVVTKKHYDVRMVDLEDPTQFTIQLLWDGQPLPPLE